jgi:hypothetical protein
VTRTGPGQSSKKKLISLTVTWFHLEKKECKQTSMAKPGTAERNTEEKTVLEKGKK